MLYNKKWDTIIPPWRDLIERGANLIDKQGLCKHTARNAAGEHCISGALQDAGGLKDSNTYIDAFHMLWLAANQRGWMNFIAFNNAPETTKDDVIEFMLEVARG